MLDCADIGKRMKITRAQLSVSVKGYARDFRAINVVGVPWNTVKSTTENAMLDDRTSFVMINLNAKNIDQ